MSPKIIRTSLVPFIIATAIAGSAPLCAQQSQQPDSVVAIAADLMSLPIVPPDQRPFCGTYWEVRNSVPCLVAPTPCPPLDPTKPVYAIGSAVPGGQFLVDATIDQQLPLQNHPNSRHSQSSTNAASIVQAQLAELQNFITQVQARQADAQLHLNRLTDAMTLDSQDDAELLSPMNQPHYITNGLWLEITNVSNAASYLNLHNATNQVYAILTTTNLLTHFAPEVEVWPSDTNCQPFTLWNNGRQILFMRALDWTDIDSNGDGIPDWWAWKYFGVVNPTDTNLDYSGNGCTFAQDYSNNITPTVFLFTDVAVTNNYVNTNQPNVQLDVAGTPYYIATLIDDNNFSNAVWNTYSSPVVTVNLGSVQGWHDVWIGLRAHADAPTSALWQHKRLKLDCTPPALFITTPTSPTVDIPMIQLQGFSPEALGTITFDLTNAAALLTNQQILVLNQHYDTTKSEFTTNYFQAFDVLLTNGINAFIFHATDLAGNTTTATYSVNLDYSAKTNPPSVQVTWPQPGTQISGNSFTVNGQVADATITIAATITDTNGNTNTAYGLLERTGKFWVENLPLNTGTNTVTLNVTDVAGNSTNISFTVSQSAVTLTVNPVSDPQQLWHPTVNLTGSISDAGYAVWVNGVRGTNNGDGTWSANNVPVNNGGTASFTATAYAPDEQQPDGTYGN